MDGLEWLKEKNLTSEKLEKVRQLNRIAEQLDLTLAQLGLMWCLKNENVSTVILGASQRIQLEENLAVLNLTDKLADDVMQSIELVLNNKPLHPAF